MKHAPKPDLLVRVIDGEVVILDRANEKIHQLNLTASTVWNKLCRLKDPVRVAEELSREADISLERATEDVTALIEQLESAGLFEATEQRTEGSRIADGR